MIDTTVEDTIRRTLERDFKRVNKYDMENGGIYIETTDDPRGWMLGDNTRKIYEVPNLYIKELTDLLVLVTSNDDGSKIKVSVYNPLEIKMMLLSKNDDVGSSIQYADINVSKTTELVAKMGEHICIESIMRGSWIRVKIFPGSNILETIKVGRYEILKFLEVNETLKIEKLKQLVDRYYNIREEIDIAISGLRCYGASCDCDSPLVFKEIHEGKFDEILQICLECGGTVER